MHFPKKLSQYKELTFFEKMLSRALKLVHKIIGKKKTKKNEALEKAALQNLTGLLVERLDGPCILSLQYFQKAAEKGLPQALFNVGRYHLYGYAGLNKNSKLGLSYITVAADQGDPDVGTEQSWYNKK